MGPSEDPSGPLWLSFWVPRQEPRCRFIWYELLTLEHIKFWIIPHFSDTERLLNDLW